MTVQELYNYARELNCLDYEVETLDWSFDGNYEKVTSKSINEVTSDPKSKTILIV